MNGQTEIIKAASGVLKPVLIGVAVIIAAVAIYFIGKKAIEKIKTDNQNSEDNKETLDATSSEINTSNLSFGESEYSAMAQTLYQCFKATGFWHYGTRGVDEDGIYIEMRKLKTDDDVKKLIEAYGTKSIKFKTDSTSQDLTLPATIAYMMATNEKKRINRILRGNNINYQF